MYISYYTLNYSQFSTENFDFFGTPSYWYFVISSVQWQFLTRRKKPHAISINTERVRSPRVQTFWWHLSNGDVCPGEFQPYVYEGFHCSKCYCDKPISSYYSQQCSLKVFSFWLWRPPLVFQLCYCLAAIAATREKEGLFNLTECHSVKIRADQHVFI